MASDLEIVQQRVSNHMDEIVSYFKPGVKIAVMVRTPDHPTRDFMMTDDSIPELKAMLERQEQGNG